MKCSNFMLLFLSMFLVACGGNSDTSNNPSPNTPTTGSSTGTLSIALSDAPMRGVTGVMLQLDELVMTDESNVQHHYSLQGQHVDLIDYQGSHSLKVVDGLTMPIGNYHNVYMSVIQGDGNNGCYVEDDQGIHAMQVQDGRIPLMDFAVVANQHHSFTAEIGLYMGLHQDQEHNYTLSHHGSWSVNNRYMGHLLGEVDPQWIAECETQHSAMLPVNSEYMHLAYLYPNTVTSLTQMGDVNDAMSAGHISAIAVAPLRQDSAGNWYFEMGYLPEGTYRVGYSCLGDLDDPHRDDINSGLFSMFADAGTVTIDAGADGGSHTVMQCGRGNGGHHGG